MKPTASVFLTLILVVAGTLACGSSDTEPVVLRLVDVFDDAAVEDSPVLEEQPQRTEWRSGNSYGDKFAWQEGLAVTQVGEQEGRLVGRTTDDFPILDLERISDLDEQDVLHAVEIRLSATAGGKLGVSFDDGEQVDLEEIKEQIKAFSWDLETPIVPGDEMRTYRLQARRSVRSGAIRHLLIGPSDVAGARFEIESARLIFRKQYLAGIPSGVSWQGLSEIYHETLVSRAPESIRFELDLPSSPRLDLSLGTVEEAPVTFKVETRVGDGLETLLERTITTPHRWEAAHIDLERYAGRRLDLTLSLAGADEGALGFWGSPAVRNLRSLPELGEAASTNEAPQGVILIVADTLRKDHLGVYGYERITSPTLDALAQEGVLVEDAISQATWTKASMPSILTSLYPGSHTVREFHARLPASAHTLVEVYREAGYATLGLGSIVFVGKFTNLHQGFEQFHEPTSWSREHGSKVAREQVDRLLPWLERHREVPFFVLLHIEDPHDPFEPYRPYDRMWADPGRKEQQEEELTAVREIISEPLLKRFGMPTREELAVAGVEAEAYVAHEIDWYDGSIRALDAEVARLLERLRGLHLAERTLIAFVSDHGEEFLEHGRHFHGQSTYGELTRVPMILHGPGVAAGAVVQETVQTIDLMPTLLELSGLEQPASAQGRSLVPLFSGGETTSGDRRRLPAFSEKVALGQGAGPPPKEDEAYAVIQDGWKLIHNTRPPEGRPEIELFDHREDPLNMVNLAEQHPDIVERLRSTLDRWHGFTAANTLPSDAETAESLSQEEMEQLKALGYLQ